MNNRQHKKQTFNENWEVVSRADYQEIILARMAGGGLDASALLIKVRKADQLLDALREKPIYTKKD